MGVVHLWHGGSSVLVEGVPWDVPRAGKIGMISVRCDYGSEKGWGGRSMIVDARGYASGSGRVALDAGLHHLQSVDLHSGGFEGGVAGPEGVTSSVPGRLR